jgi:uncharacterized cupredoxin-like copper-binding protein
MRRSIIVALAVFAAAPPAAAEGPTVVNVQISNFKLVPRDIILDHGRSYVLRLRNVADGGHDFTAHEFFAAAAIAPEDRRWVTEGEVEVPAGQVRDIRITAPAAGRYKLKCTHGMHKFFGMSGEIIVR